MGSRKSVKIAATVLLIVGNLFMLPFLGTLIFYTVLLGQNRVTSVLTLLFLPAYIAFVSYKVGSVLGLLHILAEPRRPRKWILLVIKILMDIVFFLSAVLMILESIPFLQIGSGIFLFSILLEVGIIVIAASCYIASFCVWYCFLCVQKPNNVDDQENGDINNEEVEMDSMDERPPV